MKIIHTGDLHFDSKMETYLSKEKAKERKLEIRFTFQRLVEYANENNVKVIIISGDMFDTKNILVSTKNFILELIERYSNIDFLILKGNHDEFEFDKTNCPANMKFFGNDFNYFYYGNVCISGLNLEKSYLPNNFDLLNFNKNNFNILCLHGQVSNFFSENIDYCIPLNALKNKNIDYLALGHIHNFSQFQLDDRCVGAYCGILEPRGFDECGDKGFIEIDIEKTVSYRFVKFSKRNFNHIQVDISGVKQSNDIQKLVLENLKQISVNDLIKVELVGDCEYELEKDLNYLEMLLNEKFYFAKVIDKSQLKIDYEKIKLDISLKGEFLNLVANSNELSDEEKSKIITYGIKALTKGEI